MAARKKTPTAAAASGERRANPTRCYDRAVCYVRMDSANLFNAKGNLVALHLEYLKQLAAEGKIRPESLPGDPEGPFPLVDRLNQRPVIVGGERVMLCIFAFVEHDVSSDQLECAMSAWRSESSYRTDCQCNPHFKTSPLRRQRT